MFPDEPKRARHAAAATATPLGAREQPPSTGDGEVLPSPVVAVGRSTLYDSFELNAMVVRLNRLLHGVGARRPAPCGAGRWLSVPKALLSKVKCALLRRGKEAAS